MGVSFGVYVRMWFAQMWRAMMWTLLGLIILAVALFAFSLGSMTIMRTSEIEWLQLVINVMGAIGGLVIGFAAWLKSFRAILNKNFSGYRLMLVPASAPMPMPTLTADAGSK